jgi:hypothetical protein
MLEVDQETVHQQVRHKEIMEVAGSPSLLVMELEEVELLHLEVMDQVLALHGGPGGNGLANSISNSPVTYAGGGGGGGFFTSLRNRWNWRNWWRW